jgi:ATP-dependent helicase HrpA
VLTVWHRVQARSPTCAPAARARDLTAQLDALVGPGSPPATAPPGWPTWPATCEAAERRIEKLRVDPARDAAWTAEVAVVADEYAQLVAALPPGAEPSPALREIRWMIEELRVSLYAHPMRTRYPVSVRRIQQAIDAL